MGNTFVRRLSITLAFISSTLALPIAQDPPRSNNIGNVINSLLGHGYGPETNLSNLLGSALAQAESSGDVGGLLNALDQGTEGAAAKDTSTPVILQSYRAVTERNDNVMSVLTSIPSNGDASAAIKDAAGKIGGMAQAMTDAVPKISVVGQLSPIASTSLQVFGEELSDRFQSLSDNMIQRKAIIEKANQKNVVRDAVKGLRDGATKFTSAINGKIPASSKQDFEAISKQTLDSIDRLTAAFA